MLAKYVSTPVTIQMIIIDIKAPRISMDFKNLILTVIVTETQELLKV